jgi:4-hydroxybenzoate polyprenyltransferase
MNKQQLDQLISFLSISSIIVALIGFFVPYSTFMLYGIAIDYNLLLSSFLLAFSVYSLDKLSGIKEDSMCMSQRSWFISCNKKILIYITITSYVIAVTLAGLKNILALLVIISPICIGLLYSIKISKVRLKDIPALKNISISTSWALVGAFLPLSVESKSFILVALLFYFGFIKCFINTVLFDVRDIEGDNMNGVRTIPVIFGLRKTKRLLLVLNSTLMPWIIICLSGRFFHQYVFILILSVFYGYGIIFYFCRENKIISKSIDLFVDGEWIWIAICILLFSKTDAFLK